MEEARNILGYEIFKGYCDIDICRHTENHGIPEWTGNIPMWSLSAGQGLAEKYQWVKTKDVEILSGFHKECQQSTEEEEPPVRTATEVQCCEIHYNIKYLKKVKIYF